MFVLCPPLFTCTNTVWVSHIFCCCGKISRKSSWWFIMCKTWSTTIFGCLWLMSSHFSLFDKAVLTLGPELQHDWSLHRDAEGHPVRNWQPVWLIAWSRGNLAGQTEQWCCPSVCLNSRNRSVCVLICLQLRWLMPACQGLAGLSVSSVFTGQEVTFYSIFHITMSVDVIIIQKRVCAHCCTCVYSGNETYRKLLSMRM